ncbi:MAG: hypothetical protein JW804_00605, partial [Sedimentisphaerales bacterium]|nr:hypothetical protein [Sedimentisphaerales bacterium]
AGGEINIPETGPDFNASQTFTNLAYNTTYYWRVNEVVNHAHPNDQDPNKVIPGYVWSFTTIGEAPEITVQPTDALADYNEIVLFEVTATSATTPTYYWFKSTDATVGGDTLLKSGSEPNLAVIANDSNDAYYYVYIENAAGPSQAVTSDIVHLWLKREIARYKLNNDLTDSTTAAKGGTAEWDAAGVFDSNIGFVTDFIEGTHSLELRNDVNAFVSVPNSEDYFNHYVRGLTVNCWVKVNSTTGYDALVTKHALSTTGSESSGDWEGWTLQLNNGAPLFEVRHGGIYATAPSIADANWHMLTARYNYYEGHGTLYVDGEIAAYDDQGVTPDNVKKTPLDRLAIGSCDSNDGGYHTNPFDGWIDDVRIWTYPLTGAQIAALYIDDYGDPQGKGSICVNNWYPQYDFSGDCKVDFADFAMFAEDWLDCNLYPPSACN